MATPINLIVKQKLILILSVLIILVKDSGAYAQDFRLVSGVVTAFKNIPLKKVKVSAAKSGETAFTDYAGQFVIKSLNKDVLTFAASGFVEKKIRLTKDKTYIINIEYANNVTSFNKAIKNGHIAEDALRQAINSASSGPGKDYSKYKTIYELISCEIYNVRVKGTSIVNTKIQSFDSSPQVLYVVDDKIVSDISYISPDYVKKIEFIDDVGTTLYGMQGANGVIKITLKQ